MTIEHKNIELRGVRSHIEVSGKPDGQPIVLLHGWGCKAATLQSIANVAAPTHRVYNVDFPGFGQSQEPPSVWGVEDYALWLRELVEHFGLESPVLLGHSFGGRVAILYASQWPVSKVVLVDAAGIVPVRTGKITMRSRVYKAGKRVARLLGKRLGGKLTYWLGSQFGSPDYRNSSPQMRAVMSRVINEDLCYAMPSIKAPTLLIWGENDTATPLADAKKMESLIPDAGLVSFPRCGHYSFLDNPAQFAAVLRSFLGSD